MTPFSPRRKTEGIRENGELKMEEEIKIKSEILDAESISRALTRISHEILEKNRGAENLAIVGIKKRGDILAERIAENK